MILIALVLVQPCKALFVLKSAVWIKFIIIITSSDGNKKSQFQNAKRCLKSFKSISLSTREPWQVGYMMYVMLCIYEKSAYWLVYH